MRYRPEQVDYLAAEYVIGTLHGGARRRFETLMQERGDVRLAVWRWERLLHGLTAEIERVRPPQPIWRRIARRIAPGGRRTPRAASWWPRLAIVTPVLAALAVWLITSTTTTAPERMAIFADDAARVLWIISTDADSGTLFAESSGVPLLDPDLVYELWALTGDGTPQSLGVLETAIGRYERPLSSELLAVLEDSSSLAISLEPEGGSPTGAPTGPVVYQASLVRL